MNVVKEHVEHHAPVANSGVTRQDPVCGMSVEPGLETLTETFGGDTYHFCSSSCQNRFRKDPVKFVPPTAEVQVSRSRVTAPLIGGFGGLALIGIFAGVVILVNSSTSAAWREFERVWYWVLILAGGFGFQLGLYTYIRSTIRDKMAGATAEVTASGAISTGSMIACCSHGLVNLLPMLGVSAAAAFLAQYQLPLILLGVFSNLVGITIMLGIVKKHDIAPDNALGRLIGRYDMRLVRYATIGIGIMVISLVTFFTVLESSAYAEESAAAKVFQLDSRKDKRNAVTVEVEPRTFRTDEAVRFEIAFDTHSVALDFDVASISHLEDDAGNILTPLEWDGDEPGGHHRSGTLTFPAINPEAKSIRLVMKGIANVPERVFEWQLL